jgi:hypothetical protein
LFALSVGFWVVANMGRKCSFLLIFTKFSPLETIFFEGYFFFRQVYLRP